MKKIYFILFVGIVLWGCAKPGGLTGGPKDKIPPVLDSLKSTSNYQTNYFPDKIVLYFDEWIQLKQKNQILISPPLGKRVKITQRGKHVTVEFNKEDTLKPNTTYSINFGKSIVDFTEGNPVPNLVYVFSTGDKIDSLEVSGKVVSAIDGKPQKDITVLLYDTEKDSVVVKSKPYYFTNTDKNGNFKIKYIKEGYFKVFALKDGNANYLYDMETEEIGYVDTMVFIHDDTIPNLILMKMFTPTPQLRLMGKSIAGYGKLVIEYNRIPDSVKVIKSSVNVFNSEILKDSFFIYYDNTENPDSINLVLKSEINIDTLILKRRKTFENPIPLVVLQSKKSIKLHPEKYLNIKFNQPFSINDTSKIELYETIVTPPKDTGITAIPDTNINHIAYTVKIDSLNKRLFKLKGEWEEGKAYKLKIMPGYLNSLYNVENDTIEMKVSIDKKENFSNLVCHLDSLEEDEKYVVLLKKDKNIITKNIVSGTAKKDLNYIGLKPGKYILNVIVDANGNGRWDGGDYFKRLKAEKIYTFTLNELKTNWNQEENIILKSTNSKKKDDIKN